MCKKVFLCCFFSFFTSLIFAQSILNDKYYYDTLKPFLVKGSFSFQGSLNDDGTKALNLSNNAIISYATNRHLFELSESFFFNSLDKNDESNRLNIFFRGVLNRHLIKENKIVKEAKWFPEFLGSYFFDEGRGLQRRFQFGGGITWNSLQSKNMRFKVGNGLVFENEAWRVIDVAFLPALDTLSPALLDYLFNTYDINRKGQIVKNNIRTNTYVQVLFDIKDKLNINCIASLQYPLFLPYKNIPQLPIFPTLTKHYPRFTIDMAIKFILSKKIYLLSRIYGQFDEGQISPFAEKKVYNIAQGIGVNF